MLRRTARSDQTNKFSMCTRTKNPLLTTCGVALLITDAHSKNMDLNAATARSFSRTNRVHRLQIPPVSFPLHVLEGLSKRINVFFQPINCRANKNVYHLLEKLSVAKAEPKVKLKDFSKTSSCHQN